MQYKKDEIEQAIIGAASDLFAEKGVKNTSIKEIAKRAHTTSSNLYNYFKSKDELLEAVVKGTALKVDAFLELEYKKFLSDIDVEKVYAFIKKVLPERIEFFTLGSAFITLMEGCEGTKYEYYQEGLLKCINDYNEEYLGYNGKTVLSKSIAYLFMQMLLETARENAGLSKLEASKPSFWSDCELHIKKEEKIVFFKVRGTACKIQEKEYELYRQEYQRKIAGLDLTTYEIILDCTEVESSCEGVHEKEMVKMHHDLGYKRVHLIFNHQQISIVMHVNRVLEELGIDNFDIIIKNRRTGKTYES